MSDAPHTYPGIPQDKKYVGTDEYIARLERKLAKLQLIANLAWQACESSAESSTTGEYEVDKDDFRALNDALPDTREELGRAPLQQETDKDGERHPPPGYIIFGWYNDRDRIFHGQPEQAVPADRILYTRAALPLAAIQAKPE